MKGTMKCVFDLCKDMKICFDPPIPFEIDVAGINVPEKKEDMGG